MHIAVKNAIYEAKGTAKATSLAMLCNNYGIIRFTIGHTHFLAVSGPFWHLKTGVRSRYDCPAGPYWGPKWLQQEHQCRCNAEPYVYIMVWVADGICPI